MVTETISFLHTQMKQGKHVLVEGANAAMLDIDFGKNSLFLFFDLKFIQNPQMIGWIFLKKIKNKAAELEKLYNWIIGIHPLNTTFDW